MTFVSISQIQKNTNYQVVADNRVITSKSKVRHASTRKLPTLKKIVTIDKPTNFLY